MCKYQAKIKFNEIWVYQNEGFLFKQGRQNSKFNRLRWTDEIFRIDKMKIRQNLTKFGGTKMKDPPQTRTPKFKTEPLTLD